jgi:hypothetical protein
VVTDHAENAIVVSLLEDQADQKIDRILARIPVDRQHVVAQLVVVRHVLAIECIQEL